MGTLSLPLQPNKSPAANMQLREKRSTDLIHPSSQTRHGYAWTFTASTSVMFVDVVLRIPY